VVIISFFKKPSYEYKIYKRNNQLKGLDAG